MDLCIMQGDEYFIPFRIALGDGEDEVLLGPEAIDSVMISIGKLRKRYPEKISYLGGYYMFYLSQEESFAFSSTLQKVQVRMKMKDGLVKGVDLGMLQILHSRDKEVLA